MMSTIKGGVLIAFVGPEGGGKSTQIARVAASLKSEGRDVVVTKEPGGNDPVCKEIREIFLKKGRPIEGMTEFYLICADRTQHIRRVILPALTRGAVVLVDRYVPDTYAYQCEARGALSPESFRLIMGMVTESLHIPDLTIWYDLPVEVGLGRKKAQDEITRLEHEEVQFHQNVARGFKRFFEHYPEYRHIRIEAERPEREVFDLTLTKVLEIVSEREARNSPE